MDSTEKKPSTTGTASSTPASSGNVPGVIATKQSKPTVQKDSVASLMNQTNEPSKNVQSEKKNDSKQSSEKDKYSNEKVTEFLKKEIDKLQEQVVIKEEIILKQNKGLKSKDREIKSITEERRITEEKLKSTIEILESERTKFHTLTENMKLMHTQEVAKLNSIISVQEVKFRKAQASHQNQQASYGSGTDMKSLVECYEQTNKQLEQKLRKQDLQLKEMRTSLDKKDKAVVKGEHFIKDQECMMESYKREVAHLKKKLTEQGLELQKNMKVKQNKCDDGKKDPEENKSGNRLEEKNESKGTEQNHGSQYKRVSSVDRSNFQDEHKHIELFSQSKNALVDDIMGTFIIMMKSKLGADGFYIDALAGANPSNVPTNNPVLVVCIITREANSDARNALSGLTHTDSTILLMIHMKESHALPTVPSANKLTEDTRASVGAIFDFAYLREKGLYDCPMNENSISMLISHFKGK